MFVDLDPCDACFRRAGINNRVGWMDFLENLFPGFHRTSCHELTL
jgi:hypothetical protein